MKRYEIAGLKVDMEVSGKTERQAAVYLSSAQGDADITITCDARRILDLNPHLLNEEMAEYLGSGAKFANALLSFDGLYLHASAVVLDGKAYLFSASSGTGKSTHTEKWCRLFGATYLNDDKPVLRLVDDVWMVYGTPWSGKHDLSSPIGVPLGGIAFLRRGKENTIEKIPSEIAVPKFMSQSLWRVAKSEDMDKQLSLVDRLLRRFPVWELICRNDDEAAYISRNAMTGKT